MPCGGSEGRYLPRLNPSFLFDKNRIRLYYNAVNLKLTPLKNAINTAELVADALRQAILQGQFKSKQPLRQDEIAAEFGVSKIPVREALFQLKAEGLVTFYPNRGAVVSELSAAEVDEIYAMRSALESLALRRAIPRLSEADFFRAEGALAALDQEQNPAGWSELNWEFHALLYHAARMPRLMSTVERLHHNVARYLILYLAGMAYQETSQAEHRAILAAARQRDSDAAVAHLEQHLASAAEMLGSYLSGEK